MSAQVGTAPLSHLGSPQVAQITPDGYQIRYRIRRLTQSLSLERRRRESNPRNVAACLLMRELKSQGRSAAGDPLGYEMAKVLRPSTRIEEAVAHECDQLVQLLG